MSAADPVERLVARDPLLKPYLPVIARRQALIRHTRRRITADGGDLSAFASGHEYYGLHFCNNRWILREWAPNATAIYLIGEINDWRETSQFALAPVGRGGDWVLELPPEALHHECLYRLRIHWAGGGGDRIPAWTRRVVQDPQSLIFNAQVWHPQQPYQWRCTDFEPPQNAPLVYEVHVGMAQQEARIGSWAEFTDRILPRILKAGYNTLQLMAVQEHPYYASFGYQISSFFAPSSRFGPPEDLKNLIDCAHENGVRVIMDLVHSHAVSNEVEGLSRYDGTDYQFFHTGARGVHRAWQSRCFDYGKPEVLHFLLSNCRFWLDEFNFDGFRFDGVTSMLYLDHGLERVFSSYDDYFEDNVDEDALAYLALANELIHTLKPNAITVAEDVSGMPALALPASQAGSGFDYRFAMGVPDYWIKLCKEVPDEAWPMGHLYYELTNRRAAENTISYAESHDQAMVGDQTLIFRLAGSQMYAHMRCEDPDLNMARAIALHKLIRLITLATAGGGYLNFMGNEFGHPEWIDFPRPGNNWSYRFARRQWHLAEDPALKYQWLQRFDADMIRFVSERRVLEDPAVTLYHAHEDDKVLVFERAGLLFAFCFHPTDSFSGYGVQVPKGAYRTVFDSDQRIYGGHARIEPVRAYPLMNGDRLPRLRLYLPSRTALVMERQ